MMGSPINDRIRILAQEEVRRALADVGTSAAPDGRLQELQEQITGLHENLHDAVTMIGHLQGRVEVMESKAVAAGRKSAAAPRGRRKTDVEE